MSFLINFSTRLYILFIVFFINLNLYCTFTFSTKCESTFIFYMKLIYEKNVTMLLYISLFVNSWQNLEMKVFLWSDCDSSFLSKIIFGNEMCSAWSKQLKSEGIWALNSYIYRGVLFFCAKGNKMCPTWSKQLENEGILALNRERDHLFAISEHFHLWKSSLER